jgi:Mg2+-importing ATPase
MNTDLPFWSLDAAEILRRLDAKAEGLTAGEADERLARFGPNSLDARKRAGSLRLLLAQFSNPIILILLGAAALSIYLGEETDAIIILSIVLLSGLLGFWQEHQAAGAVERLLAIVRITTAVLRDGKEIEIPVEKVVPGDIVVLNAGDVIPADAAIVESKDLYVDEAALTGETFPVEKEAGALAESTPLAGRTNALFMGTHVVSGTARALAVRTGTATEFGAISGRLNAAQEETEFERGIRHFGYLLLEVTLILVIAIFAFNVYLHRPVVDSFLFALALAVGLTPQLLPAIVGINLARGAKRMADQNVIVKRLSSIENFGSMTVLCSDKTGTLTNGVVEIRDAIGIDGKPSREVLRAAFINASFESGFTNPIDEAIRTKESFDLTGITKVDEVPYDFHRKRLSVAVRADGEAMLITKGAVANVIDVCSTATDPAGHEAPLAGLRASIDRLYEELSSQGNRVLAVATKKLGTPASCSERDEKEMTLLGFLTLFDPPKPESVATVARLKELGVALKIITGDNRLVAASVAGSIGLSGATILAGPDLQSMSQTALIARAARTDIFAEVEPNQKERIIRALRTRGEVVGYLGDGINDAAALHAADVGISVESAVDVAKDAAAIVLLRKELGVLIDGILEGRRTFANTLKYIFMATSANFGNMFSMAGASLFLPFLPLLPKQILLTNLLTDIPEMTIAGDNVDHELVASPRRWDIRFIRRFMITFGLVSSLFDYITFALLLGPLHAGPEEFRAGWFVESVVSASLIVLVIRTRKRITRSRPGRWLALATLCVIAVTIALPYTPLGPLFGFAPLPLSFLAALAGVVAFYVLSAEIAKMMFYRRN